MATAADRDVNTPGARMRSVRAAIGYSRRTPRAPYFYANAHEKDYVPLAPVEMEITDARGLDTSLDREGFVLVEHASAVPDLTDMDAVARTDRGEIADLLQEVTGCDHVAMTPMGILRFSEASGRTGSTDNSHPARFAHVDMAKDAAAQARAKTAPEGREIARSAQYNVWRVLSQPPQDVPLALCAYTSLDEEADLIDCTAIFDPPDGKPEWSFANYVIAHNPAHRWHYYSNMHPSEAIIFKTSESDSARAQMMPHGAFDNPLAPGRCAGAGSAWRCAAPATGSCNVPRETGSARRSLRSLHSPGSGRLAQLSGWPCIPETASWMRSASAGSDRIAWPMALKVSGSMPESATIVAACCCMAAASPSRPWICNAAAAKLSISASVNA